MLRFQGKDCIGLQILKMLGKFNLLGCLSDARRLNNNLGTVQKEQLAKLALESQGAEAAQTRRAGFIALAKP